MRQPDRPDEMPTFLDDRSPGSTTPRARRQVRRPLRERTPLRVRPRGPKPPGSRKPFASRLRSHVGYQLLVVLLVIAVPLVIVARLHDAPPPIRVLLNDKQVLVSTKTTFGALVQERKLHAVDGRLLDVQGKVLNPHADPGEITLNGDAAKRTLVLQPGDRIVVQDGKDKTEPTVTKRTMLPGRNPGNP